MKRLIQMVLIVVLIQTLLIVTLNAGSAFSTSPGKVDKKGLTVKAESEYVISGYLTPLNSKYKLRSTETVVEPGGYLGEHRHAGPGIRFIKSGAITSVHLGKTVVYKAGDQFYESGSAMHALQNKTNEPVRILNVELLPVDWKGASAIPLQSVKGTSHAAPTSAMLSHAEEHP